MENSIFNDIPSFNKWVRIEKINKGWSKDQKYYIESKNGENFLLRLSDISTYDNKKKEFEMMKKVIKSGITMSRPIDFGICGNNRNVYSLLSYVDGVSAEEKIRGLTDDEQFNLGIEAGRILKKFHSIPAPKNTEDWEPRMVRKLQRHLDRYKSGGLSVKNDSCALEYVQNNMDLLKNRPQTFQHGDFHLGNLILTEENTLGVIDFNRWDFGDPYEEFYKMNMFSREVSIPFARGQIIGYFGDKIPDSFFKLLALYTADTILFSIVWAVPFGKQDVEDMIKRAEMILVDYDNFKKVIPKWYINRS
ncbi:MAG: phosphotransferase [Clostridiaceae bacterium]